MHESLSIYAQHPLYSYSLKRCALDFPVDLLSTLEIVDPTDVKPGAAVLELVH